ncbi:MAG TPA: 23S rRNA (guanosine(2251)-2'-O)-methyltransferase RlmB [Alphaproteobacteria bacterium]|nr:23S rRNA (guanosine(2251)-2'-O)-methyltransferase RlmB [Alphaproteobacteria bacterium]HOO50464.1 23S rRNA (guanosine(2251)-2'-O)-methyltransferase RlmB [Alphaproteobacteria bacterium]
MKNSSGKGKKNSKNGFLPDHSRNDRGGSSTGKRGAGRRPPTRQGSGNGPKPDAFKKQRQDGRSQNPRLRISLYGVHAVEAALANDARVIHHIYATESSEDEAVSLVERALAAGRDLPPVTLIEKEAFDRALPKGTVHQGVGIDCDPLDDVYLPDVINRVAGKDKSVILVLDQVTDPHNMGAIIRSACAFGADAIIVQSRNAPDVNGLIAKIASGAVEHISVVYETNLARAIETLQGHGYFAVAMDERGDSIVDAPSYQKTILVLGAEGPGLRPLIRDKCDLLVKLPTYGALSSLNVSNAAAVALYAVCSR